MRALQVAISARVSSEQQAEAQTIASQRAAWRDVSTPQGGGPARFAIHVEEARVVRQIFDGVGRERLTRGEVCRRLQRAGAQTRTGKTVWARGTVWGMLKHPAYRGMAACGKTRVGPLWPRLRAQRGRPRQPRRAYAHSAVPAAEWLGVPVPALLEPAVFATVPEQLRAHQRDARQRQRGHGQATRRCLLSRHRHRCLPVGGATRL